MKQEIIRDSHNSQPTEVSDEELLDVIADFLEMGYVENIVAMFKQDTRYYQWLDTLIADERFAVRLGVSVLFEYLMEERPEDVSLAIPPLIRALHHDTALTRGEAISVLALIASSEALAPIPAMVDDPDAQVADLAREIVQEFELDN